MTGNPAYSVAAYSRLGLVSDENRMIVNGINPRRFPLSPVGEGARRPRLALERQQFAVHGDAARQFCIAGVGGYRGLNLVVHGILLLPWQRHIRLGLLWATIDLVPDSRHTDTTDHLHGRGANGLAGGRGRESF
jgi:hypothetical protein